jgi:hypothetical protein
VIHAPLSKINEDRPDWSGDRLGDSLNRTPTARGKNERVPHSATNPTQSSASNPGNKTTPTSSAIQCIASAPNSSAVKSQTAPAMPVQQHHVDLSWKASSSPGVVKYNVHRCSPGGPCSVIMSVTSTNFTDTQVQLLHAYCYFVTAVAAAGQPDSGPSNIIRVEIPSP